MVTNEELSNRVIDVTPEKKSPGRPAGSKNKSTLLKEIIENNVQKQFAEFAEEAAGHLMEGVRDRDSTCTKIFWDRVMPSQKAVEAGKASVPLVQINVSGLENVPPAIDLEVLEEDEP